jgi:hypothetical protein
LDRKRDCITSSAAARHDHGNGASRNSSRDLEVDLVETDEAGRSTREFGVITTEASNLVYQSRWALDRAQERAPFEWLIDMTFERLAHFPDLYVYHFGSC